MKSIVIFLNLSALKRKAMEYWVFVYHRWKK